LIVLVVMIARIALIVRILNSRRRVDSVSDRDSEKICVDNC
jgi:hypothetical protein